MLYHPGITVIVAVIVLRAAAKPWGEGAYLSNSLYGGFPRDVIEDLAYGKDDILDGDNSIAEDVPLDKRFSVNSFRLFRPFYRNRIDQHALSDPSEYRQVCREHCVSPPFYIRRCQHYGQPRHVVQMGSYVQGLPKPLVVSSNDSYSLSYYRTFPQKRQ